MTQMKFFIDTHDRDNGTFPEEIEPNDFSAFYDKFKAACVEEGVHSIRAHVSLERGRAFCLTMAPSIEAVRRAHDKVGLPYDDIVEIGTVAAGDMFAAA